MLQEDMYIYRIEWKIPISKNSFRIEDFLIIILPTCNKLQSNRIFCLHSVEFQNHSKKIECILNPQILYIKES